MYQYKFGNKWFYLHFSKHKMLAGHIFQLFRQDLYKFLSMKFVLYDQNILFKL